MIRAFAVLLAMLLGFSSPAMAMDAVIEQLRLQVPAAHRELWLQAEARTWQPWLEQQDGFEQRSLYWDPLREEGVLLIEWASRAQWKAIPDAEVLRVQALFEAEVNQTLKRSQDAEPLFPLLAEGELQQQQLPSAG